MRAGASVLLHLHGGPASPRGGGAVAGGIRPPLNRPNRRRDAKPTAKPNLVLPGIPYKLVWNQHRLRL